MGFGDGLGTVIGGMMGHEDLRQGASTVNSTAQGFKDTTSPYDQFGKSWLPGANNQISEVNQVAHGTQQYGDFMKGYQTSPGAQYQMDQATQAQEASAAAKGGLLSGTNERALSSINQGIASTYANQAYDEYLKGNQQQFGQLESALGNMFGAIGVGTTATGQQAGVDNAQIGATSQLAQAQAKNDQGKGSGIGSMFTSMLPVPKF